MNVVNRWDLALFCVIVVWISRCSTQGTRLREDVCVYSYYVPEFQSFPASNRLQNEIQTLKSSVSSLKEDIEHLSENNKLLQEEISSMKKTLNVTAKQWMNNLALGRPAYQSSTYRWGSIPLSADLAVNGNADPDVYHGQCSHTNDSTSGSPNWLVVDLEDFYHVRFVVLTNAVDYMCAICANRQDYFIVGLTNTFSPDSRPPVRGMYSLCGQYPSPAPAGVRMTQWCNLPLIPSRYVIIQQPANGTGYMTICELEVYGEKA